MFYHSAARPKVLNFLTVFLLVSFLVMQTFMTEAAATEAQERPYYGDLVIIGAAELITVKPDMLTLRARIDTGAKTSSLGVESQQLFERDGIKWVQFTIRNPITGELVVIEKPRSRTVRIKRHGAESVRRNVVKLKVVLMDIELEREFNLTDRSKFDHPVLVGRNVLKGRFIVDVNREYSTKKYEEVEE